MTALKDFFCQNNSRLFIYITIELNPLPSRAVQPATTAFSPISPKSCSWRPELPNQPTQVKVKFTSFPCNDSSEVGLSSFLAECKEKWLFHLSVFSESGRRSAPGGPALVCSSPSFQKNTPGLCLLWFLSCKTVLSSSELPSVLYSKASL